MYQKFNSWYSLWMCSNATVAAYWKHLSSSLAGFLVAIFEFYQTRRTYIWSTTICNSINQRNQSQNHYLPLMFPNQFNILQEVFKKFFDNFICFIISYNFYVVTLWMYYLLFIDVFKRNKVNCYGWLNFPCFPWISNDFWNYFLYLLGMV